MSGVQGHRISTTFNGDIIDVIVSSQRLPELLPVFANDSLRACCFHGFQEVVYRLHQCAVWVKCRDLVVTS